MENAQAMVTGDAQEVAPLKAAPPNRVCWMPSCFEGRLTELRAVQPPLYCAQYDGNPFPLISSGVCRDSTAGSRGMKRRSDRCRKHAAPFNEP